LTDYLRGELSRAANDVNRESGAESAIGVGSGELILPSKPFVIFVSIG
jgi:hypothetical protein